MHNGKTLLHHSCHKGFATITRFLLDHGAELERKVILLLLLFVHLRNVETNLETGVWCWASILSVKRV